MINYRGDWSVGSSGSAGLCFHDTNHTNLVTRLRRIDRHVSADSRGRVTIRIWDSGEMIEEQVLLGRKWIMTLRIFRA